MSIADLFPDFGEAPSAPFTSIVSDTSLDDLKLHSYEQGYSAGWEDSQKATGDSNIRASESLIRSLEDMSFTFEEVRREMSKEVEPFFDALFQTLVPTMVASGAAEKVKTELLEVFSKTLPEGAVLAVAPDDQGMFLDLVQRNLPMPLEVINDSCLQPSQFVIRAGRSETLLDLGETLKSIEDEFGARFTHEEKEVKVG